MNQKKNKKSKNQKLHTIYNSVEIKGFDPTDYQNEMSLYMKYKAESNDENFSLTNLPIDNPLIQIIEQKRQFFLNLWETKRIPVGGGRKSDSEILGEFKKLRNKKWRLVLTSCYKNKNNILKPSTTWGSGLNQYFPEMLDVPTTKGSVLDCLRDPERFLFSYERIIYKDSLSRFNKDHSNFYSVFIEMVRIGSESHPVVNFPVLVAQFIIMRAYYDIINRDNGIENDNFVILDPCTGWAGRLWGTLCAFHKLRAHYQKTFHRPLTITYLTTDPNTAVHERFRLLIEDWFDLLEPQGSINYFNFFKEKLGCETPEFLQYCKDRLKDLNVSGVNVALTSPPYFCQEWYSNDEAQSCEKYREYQSWVDNFLSGMIKNVHEVLNPGCKFYLNIANTNKSNKKNPLQYDAVRLMVEAGMKEIITYKMLLGGYQKKMRPNNVLISKKKNTIKKFEPIFVYEK